MGETRNNQKVFAMNDPTVESHNIETTKMFEIEFSILSVMETFSVFENLFSFWRF